MKCNPPGSSVRGIFQARKLEWVAILFSRGLPLTSDQTQSPALQADSLPTELLEYVKAVYCHPAYLTYIQSTSCEMLGWTKHKLELRLPGEISVTSDTQMTPPYDRK